MSTFQFAYNFINITDAMVTVSGQDTNYPKANMLNLANLRRHYRSLVTTETTVVIDFGSARAVAGLLLNDVNFTAATIQGNATNVWTSPSFSLSVTISADERVNRRKSFTQLTAFNFRYLRVVIPAQTPTDVLAYFRIGTLVCASSLLQLSSNPSYPYSYQAAYPEPKEVRFPTGGFEQVDMGSYKTWSGSFSYNVAVKTSVTDLWTLDTLKPTDYIVFAENRGDSSKSYLCKKRGSIEIDETHHNIYKSNVINFEEVI